MQIGSHSLLQYKAAVAINMCRVVPTYICSLQGRYTGSMLFRRLMCQASQLTKSEEPKQQLQKQHETRRRSGLTMRLQLRRERARQHAKTLIPTAVVIIAIITVVISVPVISVSVIISIIAISISTAGADVIIAVPALFTQTLIIGRLADLYNLHMETQRLVSSYCIQM